MKNYIQAKPQLRGPEGLRNWYAQLPAHTFTEGDTAGSLPLENLLRYNVQAGPKAARPLRASARFVTDLFSVISKRLYSSSMGLTAPSATGPWLRHLLG